MCVSEPPHCAALGYTAWASPRTPSTRVPNLKQEASNCYFFQIQWFSRATKGGTLSLNCSDPRLQSFQILSSIESMLKTLAWLQSCCIHGYLYSMVNGGHDPEDRHFPDSKLWHPEAMENYVQSRPVRCVFPEMHILKSMAPPACSDQFPMLCICQCFSNEKLKFDILHPMNLLPMFCFKGRFPISSA